MKAAIRFALRDSKTYGDLQDPPEGILRLLEAHAANDVQQVCLNMHDGIVIGPRVFGRKSLVTSLRCVCNFINVRHSP